LATRFARPALGARDASPRGRKNIGSSLFQIILLAQSPVKRGLPILLPCRRGRPALANLPASPVNDASQQFDVSWPQALLTRAWQNIGPPAASAALSAGVQWARFFFHCAARSVGLTGCGAGA